MMKRFRLSALLLFACFPLSVSAEQTAVPLGTSDAPYGYYVYLPEGYNPTEGEWPLVVFLHGMGVTGDGSSNQLSRVLNEGLPYNIANGEDYPFLAISPQTASDWDAATLDALVELAKSQYRVDPDRIYFTGASLGGGGVWNYAKAHPEKLAAIVPISGSPTVEEGSRLIHLPTWAFHAWGDSNSGTPPSGSIAWVDDIAKAMSGTTSNVMASYPGTFTGPPSLGNTSDQDRTASYHVNTGTWSWQTGVPQGLDGQPNLTLYKDTAHDTWTRTYANENVWDWLLAQERDSGACDSRTRLIVPAGAGVAGSGYFPMEAAFDAQPRTSSACEPLGGTGGSDAPAFTGRVGYIDFGPDWQNVRITATWTRYRAWSSDPQTPYAELWWDDDTDAVNDSGLDENNLNFNSAPVLNTGPADLWVRDSDRRDDPITPQARYLLARTPSTMTDRAKEYAILGYTEIDEELIVPASAGTASGSIYFPMDYAFDGQPTLNSAKAPEGGTGGDQAPYLSDRVGYIDFGPEWYKVRIKSTWTQYRTWSFDDHAQTPYAELWWDDDTDSVNDSGLDETAVNFNTAQSLNTGTTEPWLQDRDLSANPVAPQARYLLCRSHSNMTGRAKEYAIIGFIDPNATP
jgi:poly(3-hydroxybutyrate) depolymerase